MNQITHIGLDVHKDSIAVAVLRADTGEIDERVVPNTPEAVRRLLRRHDPGSTRVCYEAGPTGYDTHRLISALGFQCDVIAPSLIPRRSGSRVKTDRIDERNLARLHRFEVWRDFPRADIKDRSPRPATPTSEECSWNPRGPTGTHRRCAARKGAHTAVVATARELSGFVWGLMTDNLGPAR
ncbi:MAG: transposase [Actinobacteria bacterium]|nr:transposase [Actinomycetota bacterium]MCL5887666.1 transposase [Actinomycetota bacterium]